MRNQPKITRRCFLHTMCMSAPALGLAMIGGSACSARTVSSPETWYIDHQKDILKENQKTFDFIRRLLVDPYGEKEAGAICTQTMDAFTSLLADLPYIGGSSNDLTANLASSAGAPAFYRVMKTRGAQEADVGRFLYKAVERQFASDPMGKAMGRLANSKLAQDKLKTDAERSKKRAYPEDWVYDFIPGDDQNDFGIDYTECGIVKYYKAQGAENFTPYLCLLDFPISLGMNTGLVRTQTIAHGSPRCDFRYKTGRDISPEWDPGYIKGG